MGDAQPLEPVHLHTPAVRVKRWSWRLCVACTAIGAVSALAAALVRLAYRGLQWALTGSAADPPVAAAHLLAGRRAVTPALGALLAAAVLFVHRQQDKRRGRQTAPYVEYVEAVRHRGGRIPLVANCWRTLAAAFSVASGAAVGREGSMIQFAAAIASLCARWRLWQRGSSSAQLSFLVACGVAGGVTTAYNAPVAAVFFAAEIVLGGLDWKELPLLGLAAGAGWVVSGALLGRERLYPVHVNLPRAHDLWLLALLAVGAGLLGPLYQWLLGALQAARRLPLALLWGGAVVGALSLQDTRVWGNGDMGLRAALGIGGIPGAGASHALLRVLCLRSAATLACVWTGTVGGVFTPTLFAGGAAGALTAFGGTGHASSLCAVAGMSVLMAAVTHAPVMAALMSVELTGNWALLPVLLPMNLLSWGIARRLSPRAMYAIASQVPVHNGAMSRPEEKRSRKQSRRAK